MANARGDHEELGEPCLLRRARAEVSRDRGNDFFLVLLGERRKAIETIAPRGEQRIGLRGEGLALSREEILQARQRAGNGPVEGQSS